MPDDFTDNFHLTKPEVGSSRDTWGAKWNVNLDELDALLAAVMPIGATIDFAGANPPDAWLICDGSVLSIATYPKLFAAIGAAFGGDGVTTFGLPDCRGRVSAGAGSTTDAGGSAGGFSLAEKTGWFGFSLAAAHLPPATVTIDAVGDHAHTGYTDIQGNHAHGVSDPGHQHVFAAVGAVPGAFLAGAGVAAANFASNFQTSGSGTGISIQAAGNHQHNIQTYNAGAHTHTGRIAGSSTAFPLYQPLIGLNKIIYCGLSDTAAASRAAAAALVVLAAPLRGGS